MEELPPRPSSSTWGTSSRMIRPSSTPSSPKSTKHSSGLLSDLSIMVPLGLTTARSKIPGMSSPRKPSRHGSQRARRSVFYACISPSSNFDAGYSLLCTVLAYGASPQFRVSGASQPMPVHRPSCAYSELRFHRATGLDETAILVQLPLRFLGISY